VRLQDHVERLPWRDVLQLAPECSLHVWIGHDAEPRAANEHEQQIGDERWFSEGDRNRPHVVEIAVQMAFIELRDDERLERALTRRRRLSRALRGSLRSCCEHHSSRRKTDFHAPRFGSKKAKP
jgi:hypothetical protein